MGELEKNEYSDDRNEEGLNGPFDLEESKDQSLREESKNPLPVGLHIDMQNALKSKFKEEFV